MQEWSQKLDRCSLDKRSWIIFFIVFTSLCEHKVKNKPALTTLGWMGGGEIVIITGSLLEILRCSFDS